MDAAVANDSALTLVEVQTRLTSLFESYQAAAKWLVYLHRVKGATASGLYQLEFWPDVAVVFRSKLNELTRHPENTQLKLRPGVTLDSEVKRFLEGDVGSLGHGKNAPLAQTGEERVLPPFIRSSPTPLPSDPE